MSWLTKYAAIFQRSGWSVCFTNWQGEFRLFFCHSICTHLIFYFLCVCLLLWGEKWGEPFPFSTSCRVWNVGSFFFVLFRFIASILSYFLLLRIKKKSCKWLVAAAAAAVSGSWWRGTRHERRRRPMWKCRAGPSATAEGPGSEIYEPTDRGPTISLYIGMMQTFFLFIFIYFFFVFIIKDEGEEIRWREFWDEWASERRLE